MMIRVAALVHDLTTGIDIALNADIPLNNRRRAITARSRHTALIGEFAFNQQIARHFRFRCVNNSFCVLTVTSVPQVITICSIPPLIVSVWVRRS